MRRKNIFLIAIFIIGFSAARPGGEEKPYLILISFDGFRWDYPHRGITPNFDKVRENGVAAMSLEPVYPTKTFPNHISLLTGMYPENHGIILNDFVNPATGERYRMSDSGVVRNSKWYLGEFFWETAERQGILTASYFWPGSEISEKHRQPTYREMYDHNRPYEKRIEGALNWLQLPEEQRPHFITLYFHETDSKGHQFGPDSPEVNEAIRLMDRMLGLLMEGLKEINMLEKTNIVIVSDHGMTEVDTERIVNIEKILTGFSCQFVANGPFIMVRPEHPEKLPEVFSRLEAAAEHYSVYYREEIPRHLHFSDSPYISPIFLIAETGWSLETESSAERLLRNPGKGGNHGYDNHLADMHGVFYAIGPAFKKGYKIGTLRNIDVYPLLCEIFNILPRKNIDGELERISFILRKN